MTADRGWGLRAGSQPISRGAFVCIYAGEVIHSSVASKRMLEYDSRGINYLLVVLENIGASKVLKTNVDATEKGNVGRFINHRCGDPNLVVVPVRTDSVIPLIAFFASRDISAGEELTISYGGLNRGGPQGLRCRCGSSFCTGFLPYEP